MGSVAPKLPNQGPGDLMQNQQIQNGELCGSLSHKLIRLSCSGHMGREVPKTQVLGGCCSILRKLKTTPPVQEVLFDLQIVGGWETVTRCKCLRTCITLSFSTSTGS